MSNHVIEYVIRAKDETKAGIAEAVTRLKEHYAAVKDTLSMETEEYRKAMKAVIQYRELESPKGRRLTKREIWGDEVVNSQKYVPKALRQMIPPWMEYSKKVNDAADANKAFGATTGGSMAILSRMPGVIGETARIVRLLGVAVKGALGPVGAIAIAFMAGYTAGKKLADALKLTKDPFDKIKEANKRAKEAAELAAEAFNKQREAWLKLEESIADSAERATAHIDKQAAAYLRLQDAMKAVQDAGDDQEELALQRQKFYDMAMAGSSKYQIQDPATGEYIQGNANLASQVGAYYDVLIAEHKKEVALKKEDYEIGKQEYDIEQKRQKLEIASRSENRLRSDVADAETKLAEQRAKERDAEWNFLNYKRRYLDEEDESARKSYESTKKRYEEEKKKTAEEQRRYDSITRRFSKASTARSDIEAELEVAEQELEAAEIRRQSVEDRQELAIDEAKKKYDDFMDGQDERTKEAQKRLQEQIQKDIQDRLAEEERDRLAMERRLHEQRKRDAREEAEAAAKVSEDAQERLSAARSAAARAWGWYRNKDSLKTQIDEEKAEAAAQVQFEKDLAWLKRRKGTEWRGKYDKETGTWRTAKEYSLDDEAVRRVAIAREEEKAAERYARETAENAQAARDFLEKIAEVITEEE